MKTLAILLTAFTLSLAPVNVNAQISASNSTPLIYQKIQQSMHVPENMKATVASERVRIVFTIDEKGHAHVVDIASGRTDIHPQVIHQFESIDFSGTGDNSGQTYSIWLNFNVI
jgi:hypothetical protein